MRSLYILVVFLFLSLWGNAQTELQGTVSDKKGTPLEGIHILVGNPNTTIILAFAATDSKGHFRVKVQTTSDSLEIKTSSINYRNEHYTILNKSRQLNFILIPKVMALKEVTVKGKPIYRISDTISYLVRSFTGKKDRVLADVLKKMPGIEVKDNGQILYQGEPIEKYYVNGMDPVGGKYNVINNNLPHTSVASVQILENHQPKKMLRGKILSNRTSINIKLKKDVTATGNFVGGLGFSPLLWEANITPMIFGKNQQLIASYQTNNVGNDVSRDLKTLTLESFSDVTAYMEEQKNGMLGILNLSVPDFSTRRYLFNNVHLINLNYLVRTQKESNIRVNFSYLNDVQQSNGSTNITYYLPADTLSVGEKIQNTVYFNSLQGKVTLNRNTSKIFLKNSLRVKSYWDSKKGNVESGMMSVNQHLQDPFHLVDNSFTLMLPVKKNFVTVASTLLYSKTPQKLQVRPGQFADILNDGNPYDAVIQYLDLQNVYTHNYVKWGLIGKKWKSVSKLGFLYKNQNLESRLEKVVNGNTEVLGTDFLNRLKTDRIKPYLETAIRYEVKKLNVRLGLPLSFLSFSLSDQYHALEQKVNKFLLEPSLSVRYDWNAYWKLSGSAGYKNDIGTGNQVYYGYILQNYRSLQLRKTPIPETQTQNYSASLEFSDPINSVFANLRYQFSFSRQNLIYQSEVADNGAVVLSAREYNNARTSHRLSGYFSYYWSPKKTTFSVEPSIAFNRGEQIVNNVISTINSRVIDLNPKLIMHLWSWMDVEYKSQFSWYKTMISSHADQYFSQFRHYLNLDFYPGEQHYIGLTTEASQIRYYGQKNNNYFADILYRYSFKKRKIDLEARWNNILNNASYESVYMNGFVFTKSVYELRPSQFLVSIRFLF